MQGILAVNSLVVPMMLSFTILIAVKVIDLNSVLTLSEWYKSDLSGVKWMISPIEYAALNIAFIQAVMVPLGSEVEDESALKWGGFWGGLGLGFMLLVSHFAMDSRMQEILKFEVPMVEIIRGLGSYIHILFLLVIYGEIFTTLIGNVFGMTRQIQSLIDLPTNAVVLIVLLRSFLISQVGFISLLSYLYPLFGYLGMILLVFLKYQKV